MHRTAKVAVATMFSALLLVGCGQGAGVKTDFSDRQIFEGVMFGAGPVAILLPEARDHLSPELYARSPDELNAMADARAAIIAAIESAHPGFLTAFARAARSGDPAQAHLMIMLAADAISGAAGMDATSARDNNLPTTSRDNNLPTTNRNNNLPTASINNNLPTTSRDNNLPTTNRNNNLPVSSLFSSRLFTEQLANSIAVTFGRASAEH